MEENEINYLIGDATRPVGEGMKLIIHCCNDIGAWGAGFVVALSRRWELPEKCYREWCANLPTRSDVYAVETGKAVLGEVQFVKVKPDIVVGNMIGQRNVYPMPRPAGGFIPPIRYDAIEKCLNKVVEYAKANNCSVHFPKFGAGLAGGDWGKIEELINKTLIANGIECFCYELK